MLTRSFSFVSQRPFSQFTDAMLFDLLGSLKTTGFQLFSQSFLFDFAFMLAIHCRLLPQLFDPNCSRCFDISAPQRWKRHSGAGPRAHRHTSTEYTLHNTAVAQAFIIAESSFIPCSRQCTSTRPFTPISPSHYWTAY